MVGVRSTFYPPPRLPGKNSKRGRIADALLYPAWGLLFALVIGVFALLALTSPRRKGRKRLELEVLGVRIVPSTLHQYTDATGDKLASDAANWTNGPIAAGDSLIFDGTSGPQSNDPVTFDGTFNTAVSSIAIAATYSGAVNVNANLNLPMASLSDLSAPAPVNIAAGDILTLNQFFLSGGTINGPGMLQIVNGQQAGTINVWNGATLSGLQLGTSAMTQFNVQGDVTFSNGSSALLIGATNWTGGNINVQTNSTITNVGAWVTTCDQKIIGQAGTSFFNCGSFSKNTTTGQTNLLIAFSNAPVQGQPSNPVVNDNSGTIEFTTSANQAGTFSTNAGATLLFDSGTQTFTGASQFSGTGAVTVNNVGQFVANTGVTVTVGGPAFTVDGFAHMGGPIDLNQGPGYYSITSSLFTWSSEQMQNAVVTSNGPMKITGNPMTQFLDHVHLVTMGQTTWDATCDLTMTGSTIDNYGTFQVKNAQTMKDQPAGNAPISAFSNDGNGTLTKLAGGATTFTAVVNNAGTIDFNGFAMTFGAAVAGGGPLTQSGLNSLTDLGGGAMTLQNADPTGTPTFYLNGGRLTGAAGATINGNIVNGGELDFNNVIGTLTINGNYTQTASGSLTVLVGVNGGTDLLNISGQASLAGHLLVQGKPGGPFHILHAAGGVLGAFADVTSPWEAVYLTDDVEVQTAGG